MATDSWKHLVEALDAWTAASELAAGQIEVLLPPSEAGRRAVVVMTPDQWEEMTGTMWGNFDDAFEDVKRTLLSLQPKQGFAVYANYRLEPSTAPTLTESQIPTPEPGGAWVASDSQGRVQSRFADWSEPDELR